MKERQIVKLGDDLGGVYIDAAWLEHIVRDAIAEIVRGYRLLGVPATPDRITEAVVKRLRHLYDDEDDDE